MTVLKNVLILPTELSYYINCSVGSGGPQQYFFLFYINIIFTFLYDYFYWPRDESMLLLHL